MTTKNESKTDNFLHNNSIKFFIYFSVFSTTRRPFIGQARAKEGKKETNETGIHMHTNKRQIG
jgi:hypothetical protein